MSRRLKDDAAGLYEKWTRFRNRDMDVEDFRVLSDDLNEFLQRSTTDGKTLHDTMNQILMAQKVIRLVKDVEGRLISLVKLAGEVRTSRNDTELKKKKMQQEDGPAVPGVTQSDVVHGQDEVDDLLSSLGF